MKRILLTLLFAIAILAAGAADASFRLQAPSRVSVGDKFYVKYVLSYSGGSTPDIKASQINGCKLLYGPVVTSQQSMTQIINGAMSSQVSIEYTCTFRAEKEGTYTIPPASVSVDGKKLSSQSSSITVGPASTTQPGTPNSQAPVSIDDIDTQTADRKVNNNDVFVRIILSKSSAYEQEAIECTIKLYTKYSISQFFPTAQPGFDGFLVEEIPAQPALNTQETVNGQTYMTALLKKCILFPQKSGKLTISSGNYDIDVVQFEHINMGFYTVRQPVEKKIKISSNTASINILPLPQPQPAGFNGAVGSYNVDCRMSTQTFRTGEPATLSYIVSGSGNIKYLKDPAIDFPTEFEQYAPQNTNDTKVSGNNVSGKVVTDYTFIPQEVGNFKIGIEPFVYFDPAKKEYVTIDLPSFDVKVSKGVSVAPADRQDIEARNTDIRYIHKGVGSGSANSFYISSAWYWIVYVVLLGILIAALSLSSAQARRSADVAGHRLAKANKVARKRLKLAERYMKEHQSEKFYEEMLRAVWGYLSDKLSIPSSQLLRSNIAERLTEGGASEELCSQVIAVLDECEMARYTPSGSQEKIENLYQKASEAINELESVKTIKRK